MSDAPAPAVTRLSATEDVLGCRKLTEAADPMLKVFQLVTSFPVLCVTSRRAPLWLKLAAPRVTLAPVGKAFESSA